MDNEQLLQIVESVERYNEEIAEATEGRKDVLSRAKSLGYIPKVISHLVKERKKDKKKRQEEKDLIETYEIAVGLD